jgi:hypothetical protein
MGLGAQLHGSNPERLMSALGPKRTSLRVRSMSALPPKADIAESDWHVRFVPKADILHCGKERRFSITSSAIDIMPAGMVRPSALAVLRLTCRRLLEARRATGDTQPQVSAGLSAIGLLATYCRFN